MSWDVGIFRGYTKYPLSHKRHELSEQPGGLFQLLCPTVPSSLTLLCTTFVRCIDEVANTDFPEELYWQLELKEYDIKISALRQQVLKYKTALSNLARAANLSEAALMALLGYPDAAYKVWRVEYALTASRKMRLCMYTC